MTAPSPWDPPFDQFRCRVQASAIDYNGHMNDAAYAQVLADANELFLDALGLSAGYRETSGCALYTVEMTIRFLREAGLDDQLRAHTLLARHDAKRVGLHTRLLADDGSAVAEGETLYLHVDTRDGKVRAFPKDRAAVLAEVAGAHTDALPARLRSSSS